MEVLHNSDEPLDLLVVDDDLLTGPMIKAALRGAFKVNSETSGAEAIPRALRESPAVILLDLHMPHVDGYEVLRQLKQHPQTAEIPVICMSGDTDEESRKRATSLGAVGYLCKPLNTLSLSTDLQAMLLSLDIVLESVGKNRKFVIAFNQAEKYRLIREELLASKARGELTVMLSLRDGNEFCDSALNQAIEERKLVYLQIQPSLITKFPYLQDISPVIADLQGFLDQKEGLPVNLIFDDPHLVINPQESSNAIARLHILKESLGEVASRVLFFCSRETSTEMTHLLNQMAAIFVR